MGPSTFDRVFHWSCEIFFGVIARAGECWYNWQGMKCLVKWSSILSAGRTSQRSATCLLFSMEGRRRRTKLDSYLMQSRKSAEGICKVEYPFTCVLISADSKSETIMKWAGTYLLLYCKTAPLILLLRPVTNVACLSFAKMFQYHALCMYMTSVCVDRALHCFKESARAWQYWTTLDADQCD